MKFNIEKDALSKFWVQDSFGNLVEGPFDSMQIARSAVESLTLATEQKPTCSWNGHYFETDETIVKLYNGFTTDEVCQSHQGLFTKSVKALAADNPTVRGNVS